MRKLKIIVNRVQDKETKEILTLDQEIERSDKRAQDFIDKKVAEDITPKPKKKKSKKSE